MAKVTIKTVVLIMGVAGICGCGGPQIEAPRITGQVRRPQPTEPIVVQPAPSYNPSPTSYPPGWVPSPSREKRWKAIIIHHSATDSGSMSVFDEYHRNGNNWDGIGYAFVIGNGRGSGDGQVEVTYRWRDQVPGAHCGGTPDNWANVDGIGVCLVGDFTKTRPTYRQMQALKTLVRFLQKRYRIPTTNVYGHADTPGYTKGSVCPGRYFPMATFKGSL
ncbi:MAG: N-acetylmuramoyl-L-alanine amidase [Phycisphaerae bacterium]|nr:N-acetylmuramoyl-L-alanine amidase [Phycisphaerae bacterium]